MYGIFFIFFFVGSDARNWRDDMRPPSPRDSRSGFSGFRRGRGGRGRGAKGRGRGRDFAPEGFVGKTFELFKTMSVSLNSKLLPTCKDSNVFSKI